MAEDIDCFPPLCISWPPLCITFVHVECTPFCPLPSKIRNVDRSHVQCTSILHECNCQRSLSLIGGLSCWLRYFLLLPSRATAELRKKCYYLCCEPELYVRPHNRNPNASNRKLYICRVNLRKNWVWFVLIRYIPPPDPLFKVPKPKPQTAHVGFCGLPPLPSLPKWETSSK